MSKLCSCCLAHNQLHCLGPEPQEIPGHHDEWRRNRVPRVQERPLSKEQSKLPKANVGGAAALRSALDLLQSPKEQAGVAGLCYVFEPTNLDRGTSARCSCVALFFPLLEISREDIQPQ